MKIDYVIPYVDGTDPIWFNLYCANKKLNLNNINKEEEQKRFSPNILFKYQFRGIERFAPWINTVHLIVQSNSQIPTWLNRDCVHVITHDEFIPSEFLPTYNSGTIECFLHKIPGLSNCFIYANDDTYILNDIQPTDFFNGVMPLNSFTTRFVNPNSNESFERMNMNITEFICHELKRDYTVNTFYIADHVQKSMNKTIYKSIFDKYEKYIKSKITMFRTDDNLSQAFFTNYYMLSTGLKYRHSLSYVRFDFYNCFNKMLKFFNQTANKFPKLCCLNNNDNEKDIAIMCQFEKLFPKKSKYEK